MSAPQRLFLIDGYSTIFRAFYALPGLSNSQGQPTHATLGFARILHKLLREEKPDLVGIALDTGRDTVRAERYEGYKANRSPMPDDLRVQIPFIRRAIEALHIPILEIQRWEADDVIGTLAKKAAAAGFEVVLVTADKDFMQLVGPGVRLYHTMREKLYDEALVAEDFGVPPEQVIDVLALMGDSVDNVPGVPGIGEKGAKSLIKEYGSLEALLDRAAEIKRKNYREGLIEHREQALLSKELVTIATDLDIALDPGALRLDEPDARALIDLYRELEFFTLIEELQRAGLAAPQREIPPATDCPDAAAWRVAVDALGTRREVALIGGAGEPEPTGVAVRLDAHQSLFADFRRDGLRAACRETLAAWLADPEAVLVAHDTKEVLRFVAAGDPAACRVSCRLLDTMLLAYLLRSALRSFGFEEVLAERLQHRAMSFADAGFSKEGPPMPGHVELLRLAAERVLLGADLAERLEEELAGAEAGDPAAVYRTLEEPLVPVLLRMEERGIELDTELLAAMSARLGQRLIELEVEIHAIAGEEFNLNSPQQLGVILYEKLGYPVLKRTRKTKSYSTDAETLEELAARGFDLPEKLLSWRELSKLKSTYLDAFPLLVGPDRRLHTRYQQAVAATGRLSSAEPNLQNIPVRTDVGREIRRAFRAAAGRQLLVADYSQIELRVLAHIAEDEALIAAFRKGGADIHRETAASVFGIAAELVSGEQRRVAKTINFGIAYGMSAYGLAQRLGIEPKAAKAFIDAYFAQFPGVRRYMDETIERVQQAGYVETLYGRVRFLPDVRSRNYALRENAKRMAINAPIQGTAADLLKLAMIAVERRLAAESQEAGLLLTVHDELVVEVPADDAARLAELLRAEMEGVAALRVPLEVEVGVGDTWYEGKG
ncbi:MAG TPA: DNA polymerase I [Thermoanaerobaculia bacterium]|nr:DNA polymerase I [Thermoanaerobaculia bacterium]